MRVMAAAASIAVIALYVVLFGSGHCFFVLVPSVAGSSSPARRCAKQPQPNDCDRKFHGMPPTCPKSVAHCSASVQPLNSPETGVSVGRILQPVVLWEGEAALSS